MRISDWSSNVCSSDLINFDLIYGLPHQTVQSCVETVDLAVDMRPDRFSVFGYAHIPSFKKHQGLIDEAALPDAQARHAQAEEIRTEERRGGKECDSTCKTRWARIH